ncbi:hypothetical protein QVD17_31854 [Tagetes erecta]|uniref:Uncharacterized protein n=1 Tax=Tagetes erecta TaxID=13708 RepID=A0AAD8K7U5_TARER|nr:hypothetical protein QVD17_31854 [Tagetes erecta]
MASKLYQILSTLFFLYITTLSSSLLVVIGQGCLYPCTSPPYISGGGSGNSQPTTTFSPPSQAGNYPPPSTLFPYNPPNPDYYGGGPPPPDTIVPWFPYYSRKPPHSNDQPSSTSSRTRPTIVIFLINFLLLSLFIFDFDYNISSSCDGPIASESLDLVALVLVSSDERYGDQQLATDLEVFGCNKVTADGVSPVSTDVTSNCHNVWSIHFSKRITGITTYLVHISILISYKPS